MTHEPDRPAVHKDPTTVCRHADIQGLLNAGEEAQALTALEDHWAQGSAYAAALIGWLYAYGKTIPRDTKEAERWYLRAADGGDRVGQYYLGYLYLEQSRWAEAGHWITKAALAGHLGAQYRLGILYDRGVGLRRDSDLALYWYRIAAEHGHVPAQRQLFRKRIRGEDGLRGVLRAFSWLATFSWRAAKFGYPLLTGLAEHGAEPRQPHREGSIGRSYTQESNSGNGVNPSLAADGAARRR